MSDKNSRSVAYLYDEMDPSEKLEFERDLNVDENLLIEVETLRKISEKLHNMDTIHPPDDVVDAILQTLEERKTVAGNKRSQKFVYYSAAAILILALTYGFIFTEDAGNEISNGSDSASIGTFQQILPASVNTATRSSEAERVMPWIDRNDVLYFREGLYESETSSIDSIFRQSFQKLTPITNPSQSPTARQNLHLTGSRR